MWPLPCTSLVVLYSGDVGLTFSQLVFHCNGNESASPSMNSPLPDKIFDTIVNMMEACNANILAIVSV